MDKTVKTAYFKPGPKGVSVESDGICFSTDQVGGSDCGIILYDQNNAAIQVPFTEQGRRGALYGVRIGADHPEQHQYQYYNGKERIADRYARLIYGREIWGRPGENLPRGGFYIQDFDWQDDRQPETDYSESIFYGLHVRSFTKHKSSGVKNKGTFEGLVEKIPYLKGLGITAVELLPAYEFDEYEPPLVRGGENVLNCWGFKDAFYYAPKAAYCAGNRPDHSFKNMVLEMHKAGIEVLMYFYFPLSVNRADILDIVRFWVKEYHIDGIHLLGENLPLTLIVQDTFLSGTKIIYDEYSYWEENPPFNNTGVFRDHFRTEMRRFLKGDEDLSQALLFHQRNHPAGRGSINYFADYEGFSLFDLTAFDQKHNEANGENNRDGTEYNYSWNCGMEGNSRRKPILALRTKQIKNALTFLFLAQGTPFIFSGDEFGNTRFGNNNVYCQDNEVGWIKWNQTQMGMELLEFTKFLIDFRRAHPILHMPEELQILDYAKCGYPDVSYHGKDAWRPDLSPYSRYAGIMYCGKYAADVCGQEDDFLYLAVNMHWLPQKLALPNLPKELKWGLVQCTEPASLTGLEPEPDGTEQHVTIRERSIGIFKSCPIGRIIKSDAEDSGKLSKE